MLFDGSVDIDHILPWSMTFDDSMANKLVCITAPNRVKTNRIPADVHQWHDSYPEILSRAAKLPFNKRWRFAADAMERHAEEDDFLARQLIDTQYLSRMATEYLDCLFPTEEADRHGVLKKAQNVRVSPGRLTELLRRSWKLNGLLNRSDDENFEAKNRYDHRHHAIDAIVIGVTTPDMVRRISSAAARLEGDALKGFIRKAVADNLPWATFVEDVASVLGDIIVSHKSDHGTTAGGGATIGGLHNDTAYGIRAQDDGSTLAVKRTPLTSITDKNVDSVLDPLLREKLAEVIHGRANAKETLAALQAFRKTDPTYHGIRRVRTGEKLKLIPIKDRNGKAYKGYKGDSNYCFDVWETLDGKWHSEVVSMFDFHQPGWSSEFRKENPTARRVMRLHQGDTVAYWDNESGRKFAKVVKFASSGRITFADHKEGGSLKARDAAAADPFKYVSKSAEGLKGIYCRQVRIDEAGKITDPGPQDRASKAKRKLAKAA
jgi:CRISPR-associated endonuclease Csn1